MTKIDEANLKRIECIKKLFPLVAQEKDVRIYRKLRRAENKARFYVDRWRTRYGVPIDDILQKTVKDLSEFLGEERSRMFRVGICVDQNTKLRLLNWEPIHEKLRDKMGMDAQGVFMFVAVDELQEDEDKE
jgi:hypothetical protein